MEKKKNLKMLTAMLIITVFCAFVMPSFMLDSQAYAASKTHLSKTSINLDTGDSQKINLILPSGKKVSASKVTWKTSSSKVVSVKKGKITGKSEGNCTVTAKYKGKKYKCTVAVKNNYAKLSSEENMKIVLERAKSTDLGALVYTNTPSTTKENRTSITYSPVTQGLQFVLYTKDTARETTTSVTYYPDTGKWTAIKYEITGKPVATMHTSENFVPSSFYYGKDLGFTLDIVSTNNLMGVSEKSLNNLASASTSLLWSGIAIILNRDLQMQMRHIGFDNL